MGKLRTELAASYTSVCPSVFEQSQKKMVIKNVWVKHTLKVWLTVQKRIRGTSALNVWYG